MCSSGCPTPGLHKTWGECVKAKGVRIDPIALDMSRERAGERERQLYREARRQGIQPATSRLRDVQRAIEISDRTGEAFQA